ncbi:hypothetical protein BDZ97DRAFT_1356127 [Flammula alnicola]|nr:hypothetical protein BDZ97DRAFT_1356127 [Flammula alnicola]
MSFTKQPDFTFGEGDYLNTGEGLLFDLDDWMTTLPSSEQEVDATVSQLEPEPLSLSVEGKLYIDLDSDQFEPHVFGEPLNTASNFAWDLAEARFRKDAAKTHGPKRYQHKDKAANKPYASAERKSTSTAHSKDTHALDNALTREPLATGLGAVISNPNSRARLGPKELCEIVGETKMQPGKGVASEFVKRSLLGVWRPKVQMKKRGSVTGPLGGEEGVAGSTSDSHLSGSHGAASMSANGSGLGHGHANGVTHPALPPRAVMIARGTRGM